jgi:hypothetical protein
MVCHEAWQFFLGKDLAGEPADAWRAVDLRCGIRFHAGRGATKH